MCTSTRTQAEYFQPVSKNISSFKLLYEMNVRVRAKFFDWIFHYLFGLGIAIFLVATTSITPIWVIILFFASVTDCVAFGLLYWWWGLEPLCDRYLEPELAIKQMPKERIENKL